MFQHSSNTMNSDAVGSQTGIRLCLCHQSTSSLSLICSGAKPCPGTGNILEICNVSVLEIYKMYLHRICHTV